MCKGSATPARALHPGRKRDAQPGKAWQWFADVGRWKLPAFAASLERQLKLAKTVSTRSVFAPPQEIPGRIQSTFRQMAAGVHTVGMERCF